jgi:hypothetical protein
MSGTPASARRSGGRRKALGFSLDDPDGDIDQMFDAKQTLPHGRRVKRNRPWTDRLSG